MAKDELVQLLDNLELYAREDRWGEIDPVKEEITLRYERLTRERDEARRWNVNQVAHELVETGLQAEIERLRAALEHYADPKTWRTCDENGWELYVANNGDDPPRIAREALRPEVQK